MKYARFKVFTCRFSYFLISIASKFFRATEFLMSNTNNENNDTGHIISPFNRKLNTVVTYRRYKSIMGISHLIFALVSLMSTETSYIV